MISCILISIIQGVGKEWFLEQPLGFVRSSFQVVRFWCLYKLEQLCNLSYNIINPKEENQCFMKKKAYK